MSRQQQCPICRARHPLDAARCNDCGAILLGTPVDMPREAPPAPRPDQWDDGETDLIESTLPTSPRVLLMGAVAFVVMLLAISGVVTLQASAFGRTTPTAQSIAFGGENTLTPSPSPQSLLSLPPTNTPRPLIPTLDIPTVTLAPPTATITPTEGPCFETAQAGDTLYGMAMRCGHRDQAVIDVILRLNNMASANLLREGQVVEIPRPTPTTDPAMQVQATQAEQVSFEPTLPPGVMWYTVKSGETILHIIYAYDLTMRIMRDLNPEITFAECEFGVQNGGPSCKVLLYEGQRVRIPAPVPTATITPTSSGSETPTPSPSPTVNAPIAQSPDDNMLYETFEIPILRWVAYGQLRPDEVYQVSVEDVTKGIIYVANTTDLSFEVPAEWQPTNGERHTFEWVVTIVRINALNTPEPSPYTTERRRFEWRGR
jgi:phage tail protein X